MEIQLNLVKDFSYRMKDRIERTVDTCNLILLGNLKFANGNSFLLFQFQ